MGPDCDNIFEVPEVIKKVLESIKNQGKNKKSPKVSPLFSPLELLELMAQYMVVQNGPKGLR